MVNSAVPIDYPSSDESLTPGTKLTVIAQPGEREGQFVFRRPGRLTILFPPESQKSMRLGSLVTGTVGEVRERSIVVEPTPPTVSPIVWEAQASRENWEPGMPPVAFIPDPNVTGGTEVGRTICVRFHTDSPRVSEIRLGSLVRGPCLDHRGTLAYVWPESVEQSSAGVAPASPATPFHAPNLHSAVPWILDQLLPASRGELPADARGYLGVEADWEAFELLTEIAFRVLQVGDVRPLGFKAKGRKSSPDGRVYCPHYQRPDYAIVYDAKQRIAGLATLRERATKLEEYVTHTNAPAKYLVIVSSEFIGPDLANLNVPGATLVYMTAAALALLATYKVMNPAHVVSGTLRNLLDRERIVDREAVERWASRYHLEDGISEALRRASAEAGP